MQRHPQQRTSGYYRIFRRLLIKIFKRRQRFRNGLYLIKNQKCVCGCNRGFSLYLQSNQQLPYVKVAFEEVTHALIVFKIDIGNLVKMLFAKFKHQPCFTNLARTSQ